MEYEQLRTDRKIWKFILIEVGIIAGTALLGGIISALVGPEGFVILWVLLALGGIGVIVYECIFMTGLVNDLNIACSEVEDMDEDKSPSYIVVYLLGLITLGIYRYVWFYKQGNRMKIAAEAYGIRMEEKGGTYVLWMIFGTLLFGVGPLVALSLFMGNVNKLGAAYNRRLSTKIDSQLNMTPSFNPEPPVSPASYGSSGISQIQVDPGEETTGVIKGQIRCISGQYQGACLPLALNETLTIGRNSQQSQLVLSDSNISRLHCSIRLAGAPYNAFYVTDYSTYGTFLNGSIRLEKGKETRFPAGSRLSLGNKKNEFILE